MGALTIEGGVAILMESLGITEETANRFLDGAGPLPSEVSS
jgi:hypothetical protein